MRLPLGIRIVVVSAAALCVYATEMLPARNVAQASPGAVDTSEQAKTNFLAWWNYENAVRDDRDIPSETAYQHAVNGCVSRNQGESSDLVVNKISRDGGFSPSGAGGVYRSAVETLCPQYRGFKSYWDRQVESFKTNSQPPLRWSNGPPPIEDYGWFLRAVSDGFYLGYDFVSIIPWLHQQPNLRLANSYGIPDDILRQLVTLARPDWP